jgi:hypothetical protein
MVRAFVTPMDATGPCRRLLRPKDPGISNLDTYRPVCRLGTGLSIINIRVQRVQRDTSLFLRLTPGYFSPTQPA